jgi:hypothetical protein
VDFFRKHQNDAGAIIDPVSKGERQYSTPAYAAAAGLLVKEAGRTDLRDSAIAAMNCALKALVAKKAADSHPDFYTPLLVHAYRSLKDVAPEATRAEWAALFARIDPEKVYRADLRKMNWNIVSSSGELLRRHDGLVAPDRKQQQWNYLEACLEGHLDLLTPIGLFNDPGAPMAYDAFSRLWLEDAFADHAYDGKHATKIRDFLTTGGLTTLLLVSPSGEWASGGRSGLHQWTDAEIAAICEMNAARWKKVRPDLAGAFKRAARLSFQSMSRWQRTSGELNIIKNRAEPEKRLAYEVYSNHSQYNLLPMAMLAIAYVRADESIAERPTPAEVGGYVLDARATFHKVAAAAGGYYVLVDTSADLHYNATGLQRVHRAGVAFPALSDTAAPERSYGPKDAPKVALAAGLQWKAGDGWLGLAAFGNKGERSVKSAHLSVLKADTKRVEFTLDYVLAAPDRAVTETYTLTADGVDLACAVGGGGPMRLSVPVLVNDGAADTLVRTDGTVITVSQRGSTTTFRLPAAAKLAGRRIVTHNGYVDEATAEVEGAPAKLRIELAQE